MPFYTVLKPEQPVLIPGKGQYLTLWVQAASDWGRVVYVVRDAKGEKWTSVGSMNKWNSDDTPGASAFNFDGWRLLRFELPSHAPYDTFREMGTTWWGSSGGDGVVDLPLSIEKIFVERRPQAMYVNSLEPTDPAPVLLADLAVEYASAEDSLPLAVTRNRTRLPAPPKGSPRVNPIAELTATATLPAGAIENVSEPDHYYDGTRGHFHFKEMPEAVRYDIYLSLSADGANAIKLGNGLKASGVLVSGFVANTDFYAFIIYYNRAGQHSQPSPAFKLNLKDNFGNK